MRKRRIQKLFYLFIFLLFIYGLIRKVTLPKLAITERVRFKARPFSLYQCPSESPSRSSPVQNFAYGSKSAGETASRVLLIAEQDSSYNKVLSDFIHHLRIPVRVEVLDGSELLLNLTVGRFSVIVFESFHSYSRLGDPARQILLDYCKENKVGIISFLRDPTDGIQFFKNTSVEVLTNQQVTDIEFDISSPVPYVGKKGVKLPLQFEVPSGWTIFRCDNTGWRSFISCQDSSGDTASIAIHDNGQYSGVEHIIFGSNLDHFIMKIGFWDALLYMLRGSPSWDLDTFIEIDIDDIFVGQPGTKLVPDDIESLIQSQDFLRNYIEHFNYTLGFSGHFFKKGDPVENDADELLICEFGLFS